MKEGKTKTEEQNCALIDGSRLCLERQPAHFFFPRGVFKNRAFDISGPRPQTHGVVVIPTHCQQLGAVGREGHRTDVTLVVFEPG